MQHLVEHSPTLDCEVLEGLCDEFGTATVTSLVANFCERVPLLESILNATRAGDRRELARNAHGLRSAASILGATRLAELATELEERALAGHFYGSEIIAREASAEFERAQAQMGAALSVAHSRADSVQPWRMTKRSRHAYAS